MYSDEITAYVNALNSNRPFANEPFAAAQGKRWVKIVRLYNGKPGSVHAFVDPETGLVYKPAGYAAPAKGARYSLQDPASFQALLTAAAGEHAYAGGYLYRAGQTVS